GARVWGKTHRQGLVDDGFSDVGASARIERTPSHQAHAHGLEVARASTNDIDEHRVTIGDAGVTRSAGKGDQRLKGGARERQNRRTARPCHSRYGGEGTLQTLLK